MKSFRTFTGLEEGITAGELKAQAEGKKAARQGVKYDDNPYEKGSPRHLQWSKGHNSARAGKLGVREEVEIDEAMSAEKILGSKPSQRYKSKDQWISAAKGMGLKVKSPSTTPEGDNNKDIFLTAFDRNGNMKGAWYKKDGVLKESVELDEISKETKASYLKKADKDSYDMFTGKKPGSKHKMDKRRAGIQKASKELDGQKKLADYDPKTKQYTREEVELEEAKMIAFVAMPLVEKGKLKKHHSMELKAPSAKVARERAASEFGLKPDQVKAVAKYQDDAKYNEELEEAWRQINKHEFEKRQMAMGDMPGVHYSQTVKKDGTWFSKKGHQTIKRSKNSMSRDGADFHVMESIEIEEAVTDNYRGAHGDANRRHRELADKHYEAAKKAEKVGDKKTANVHHDLSYEHQMHAHSHEHAAKHGLSMSQEARFKRLSKDGRDLVKKSKSVGIHESVELEEAKINQLTRVGWMDGDVLNVEDDDISALQRDLKSKGYTKSSGVKKGLETHMVYTSKGKPDIFLSYDGQNDAAYVSYNKRSVFESVQIEEAVHVDKKDYSWGRMVTVRHGNSHQFPLHPEHQAAIKKLSDGGKTRFKDETGVSITAHREGDKVHLKHPRVNKKTTVDYKHFAESVELEEAKGKLVKNMRVKHMHNGRKGTVVKGGDRAGGRVEVEWDNGDTGVVAGKYLETFKESVQIDEVLDTEKARASYVKKAKDSKERAQKKAAANVGSDISKELNTMHKREKGANLLMYKRVRDRARKQADNESVEIEEFTTEQWNLVADYLNENNISYGQLEEMSAEQLDEFIGKAIGGAFKIGAKAAVGAARLAGKGAKKAANRMTTAGRADAAEKKAADLEKKNRDRERIKKAQERLRKAKEAARNK